VQTDILATLKMLSMACSKTFREELITFIFVRILQSIQWY